MKNYSAKTILRFTIKYKEFVIQPKLQTREMKALYFIGLNGKFCNSVLKSGKAASADKEPAPSVT